MSLSPSSSPFVRFSSRTSTRAIAAAVLTVAVALGVGIGARPANAADAPVDLGTAGSFAVLAGTTVTNTGPSPISGSVGVAPGSAIVGFPPGIVTGGVFEAATAVADTAKLDLTAAYLDAEGRLPASINHTELGGLNLGPGVYAGGALTITGDLVLTGDASSVWIFQATSSLITAPASRVMLSGPVNPCNVFWQIDSTATLGTTSTMVGTVMALTTINAQTGAVVDGRLLARNGSVTLDSNTIVAPTACTVAPPATAVPGRATYTG